MFIIYMTVHTEWRTCCIKSNNCNPGTLTNLACNESVWIVQ